MHLLKTGKRIFCLLACKSPNDSSTAFIKKLALLQKKGFVQLVPENFLRSKWHAIVALDNTFAGDFKIAKNKSLEFLARVLGTRQLEKAFFEVEKNFKAGSGFVLVFDQKKFSSEKILSELSLVQKEFLEFEDSCTIEMSAIVSLK